MLAIKETIEQYTYEVLDASDKEVLKDAAECLSDTFMGVQVGNAFIREPMAGISEMKKEDFTGFVVDYLEAVAPQGFTFIARDKETGRVVGALACENFNPNEELPVFGPELDRMNSVTQFLAVIDEKFVETIEHKTGKPVTVGEYSHGFMIGVRAEHNKKHIAAEIMKLWIERAKEEGYKGLFVEATNFRSQKLITTLFDFYVPLDVEGNPIEGVYETDEVFKVIPKDIANACQVMYYPLEEQYHI